jgi:hypothetical protein
MSFEKALAKNKPKKTPVSWEPLIETILDQYYLNVDDLSHAVQKDAIQNSWDAKVSDQWKMAFTLAEDSNKREMFIMEDHGTTGLTGKKLPEEKYDEDLPEDEKWGRFQGLAFKREKKEALGARGQGKFVFVGASKTRTIIYDTLRKDKIYRLGVRKLGDLWEFEGKEAVKWLKKYSPGLEPLSEIGTRVIIDKPEEWLKIALKTGVFVRYIQTTWWPLLMDYNADISVKVYAKETKVDFPKDLQFPSSDSTEFKTWIKEWGPLKGKTRKGLFVKKLCVIWSKDTVEQDIAGIAVLRSGMVVERIPISDLFVAPDLTLSKHVYGYVEGDGGVQYKLKTCEDPTHYEFTKKGGWGHKNIYGAIKDYVSGQVQLFAAEKLGLKSGKAATGDYATLREFNLLLKSLGIQLEEISPPPPPPPPPPKPRPVKDLDLVFPAPDFQNPMRRVDYGEEIPNIQAKIVNKTKASAKVQLRVYTEQEKIEREIIWEKHIFVPAHGVAYEGPQRLTINKVTYSAGECYLKAVLVCLSHPDYEKGEELDEEAHKFWVAEDPPLGKGAYRDVQYPTSGVTETIDGEVIEVDGKVMPHTAGEGNVLLINPNYPLFKERVFNTKDEQAKKDYLVEMMIKKLPHILIANNVKPFKDIEEPAEIFKRSCALYSKILAAYLG